METERLGDSIWTPDKPLSVGDRAYFYARLRNKLHNALLKQYMAFEADEPQAREKLAKRLGTTRAWVTRRLYSPSGMSIQSLSDMMLALDCEIEVQASRLKVSLPSTRR
jgi:hypothetical protein